MSQSFVALSVKLEARTRQDGNVWLAWCPPLDVMTQAESEQRAMESLQEAVELWFESSIARNVLDKALTEAGFYRMRPDGATSPDAGVVRARQRHGLPQAPAAGLDAFTNEREIEVSIPAYVAA
ncbi:MAG: type II toxin-antitoxin system HicB family antitoxin [Bryobacteraceae bacterium]